MDLTKKDAADLIAICNAATVQGNQAERIVELKSKLKAIIDVKEPA